MVKTINTVTDVAIKGSKSYRPADCGCVSIFDNNGSIGLKFLCPISQKQKKINIGGLKWLSLNDHRIAKLRALELDNDLRLGLYDGNKNKYKLKNAYKNRKISKPKAEEKIPTLKQVWEYYKKNDPTYDSDNSCSRWIEKNLTDHLITQSDRFFNIVLDGYKPSTLTRNLMTLSGAITLYLKRHKTEYTNELLPLINSLPKQKKTSKNKSFTKEEIDVILNAFETNLFFPENVRNSSYSYYYPLVALRFYTGCRPSEAIALTWKDIKVKNGKTYIIFNKRYVKGKLKPGTKNGVDIRAFPCNEKLIGLIKSIPEVENENNLIFPSIKTKNYIDSTNFSQDIWAKLIHRLEEEKMIDRYLPWKDTRHSFCTHLCRSGKVDLPTISSLVGNSVPTLINNYLATDESVELPDLF